MNEASTRSLAPLLSPGDALGKPLPVILLPMSVISWPLIAAKGLAQLQRSALAVPLMLGRISAALSLAMLVACATEPAPWPAAVVSVDTMRALVPLHTRVEYRRRDGPPAGTVVLRLHVDVAGQVVRSVVLESSGHANLDEAALQAARRARFVPQRINGVATAVTVMAPMHFGTPSKASGGAGP